MANTNPNTSGLKPFNQRSPEEQQAIRSAGGKASAAKRRRLKIHNEMIDNLRKEFMYDPIALGYYSLFRKLERDSLSVTDTMKVLDFFERKKLTEAEMIDASIEQLTEAEIKQETEKEEVECSLDTEITDEKYKELHPDWVYDVERIH